MDTKTLIDGDYNPITDKMSITPKSDSIVLPPSAVEGLKPFQVTAMKATVYTVRNNSRIAGELIRSTASTLYEMKRNLINKQWVKFLKSGALPITEKQARDLVAAWEGWMSDSDVTDGDLVGIGTRTMARMKSLGPDERKKIVKKIKSGEKVTEKDVTPKKEVVGFLPTATGRELRTDEEEFMNLNRYSKGEVIQFALDANKRIKELEAELEFAKAG